MVMTFDELITQMTAEDPAVVRSQMFGMPTLKIGKKAFAGLHDNQVVFKLTGAAHAKAIALSGSHLFEPMEGHAMKEWVVVPADHSGEWKELAEAAKDYAIQVQSN